MRKPNPLWLVLHRTTVYNSLFELFFDRPVNGVALDQRLAIFLSQSPERKGTYEVLDCARVAAQHNWRSIVWCFPLGLGVDSPEVEFIPHLL